MFEATTYEILRYDRVKRDQAAKTIDNTPFLGSGGRLAPCYPTWIAFGDPLRFVLLKGPRSLRDLAFSFVRLAEQARLAAK
jgi:hypothetical protein